MISNDLFQEDDKSIGIKNPDKIKADIKVEDNFDHRNMMKNIDSPLNLF